MAWHEIVLSTLKANNVRLATYVPDNVLSPLIRGLHADPDMTTICATREEEAVGITTGAWLGGVLGVTLMQTSGLATLPNALASLVAPYQIPLVMIISERGTLGEFNLGQTMVWRTMRPILDSAGITHHTITNVADTAFIVERSVRQAVSTQAPVALILSPLLTAARTEKKKEG
jgi:sulfopyruvate decarboxylase alpha subunit